MNPKDVLNICMDYLSDYMAMFAETLSHPSALYRDVPIDSDKASTSDNASPMIGPRRGLRLEPSLFMFTAISVGIGLILNSLLSHGKGVDSAILKTQGWSVFPRVLCMVLLMWLLFGIISHCICWVLTRRGTFAASITVSLRLFGAVYVVAHFVTVLANLINPGVDPHTWTYAIYKSGYSDWVKYLAEDVMWILFHAWSYPMNTYFYVQFLLLATYIPLSMKPIYRLNWYHQVILALVCATLAVFLSAKLYSHQYFTFA